MKSGKKILAETVALVHFCPDIAEDAELLDRSASRKQVVHKNFGDLIRDVPDENAAIPIVRDLVVDQACARQPYRWRRHFCLEDSIYKIRQDSFLGSEPNRSLFGSDPFLPGSDA